jgi:hypothetical protein
MRKISFLFYECGVPVQVGEEEAEVGDEEDGGHTDGKDLLPPLPCTRTSDVFSI